MIPALDPEFYLDKCCSKVLMNIVFMSQVRDVVLPSEGSWIGVGRVRSANALVCDVPVGDVS